MYAATGEFYERHNVADAEGPTPGRYRPQPGFAWTNSVFLLLLTRILFDDGGPAVASAAALMEGCATATRPLDLGREPRCGRQVPTAWSHRSLS